MEFLLDQRAMPAFCEALCRLIDAGGEAGKLKLYDQQGSKTRRRRLLGTLAFAYPCTVGHEHAGGVIEFSNMEPEPDAPERGRVGWAVAEDSEGNRVFECDAGGEADAAKPIVVLDDPEVRRGDVLRPVSFRLVLVQAVAVPKV